MQLKNFNIHLVLLSSEIEAWLASDIGIKLKYVRWSTCTELDTLLMIVASTWLVDIWKWQSTAVRHMWRHTHGGGMVSFLICLASVPYRTNLRKK